MNAGILIVIGVLLYAGLWLSPESAGIPSRGQGPEWTNAPDPVRRALRSGEGPVLVVAALLQLVAIVMLIRGVAISTGSTNTGLDAVSGVALAAVIVVTVATMLLVF